jgi:drug/metabolite transporter (DMT)-like permease
MPEPSRTLAPPLPWWREPWFQEFDVRVPEAFAAVNASFRTTSARRRLQLVGATTLLLVTHLGISFGLNFFLHSFTFGSSQYVSNVMPAAVWLALYGLPCVGYHVYRGWRPWSYLKADPRTISTLAALGTADALGGLTSTYASSHVPVFLQTLLVSLGVVFTFFFTRIFVPPTPEKPRPRLTKLSACAYLLTISGVVVAAIPHRATLERGSSAGWLLVYLVAAVCPVVYNVFQARFMRLVDEVAGPPRTPLASSMTLLHDGGNGDDRAAGYPTPALSSSPLQHHLSHHPAVEPSDAVSIKLTMLTGDCLVQILVIVAAFPLDFAPWFGANADAHASWQGFVDGVKCIGGVKCSGTPWYFVLYALSFYGNHVAFAVLNHVSTTVTAFCAAVAFPLQLLLLWAFPALNVWGNHTPVAYSAVCFTTTLVAAVLFFANEQAVKRHRHSENVQPTSKTTTLQAA